MLKITGLKVKIEGQEIIQGLNLEVKPGEVVAIMGKNGSGKSTLAYALMGHPGYEVKGKVSLDGKEVLGLEANERAERGLFLASQYPVEIPGLTVASYLWQLYKKRQAKKISLFEFREWLKTEMEELDLKEELLDRGLNEAFSGGEKKKMEIIQMLIFSPKYIILDEIDSGLDIDALKKIALKVGNFVKKNKSGVLVITHYNRILKYLSPDRVVVFNKGEIVQRGNGKLALKIEEEGYAKIFKK